MDAEESTLAKPEQHELKRADEPRSSLYAIWLIIAGVVGWYAAFALTIEKLAQTADPNHKASCDFSVLVQCGENLGSWQGSVFGFPNPIIGLAGWVAPTVVGFAILAGAQFKKWFWLAFGAGILFAQGFVIWLQYQSIFSLHTLCPWCMVTWAVVIPTFWATLQHLLGNGTFGHGLKNFGHKMKPWIILLTIISYAVVALVAQLKLDWISTLV